MLVGIVVAVSNLKRCYKGLRRRAGRSKGSKTEVSGTCVVLRVVAFDDSAQTFVNSGVDVHDVGQGREKNLVDRLLGGRMDNVRVPPHGNDTGGQVDAVESGGESRMALEDRYHLERLVVGLVGVQHERCMAFLGGFLRRLGVRRTFPMMKTTSSRLLLVVVRHSGNKKRWARNLMRPDFCRLSTSTD